MSLGHGGVDFWEKNAPVMGVDHGLEFLVIPLLRKEGTRGVECPHKETGQRPVRRWVEQDASGFVLWADRNTRELDDETLHLYE